MSTKGKCEFCGAERELYECKIVDDKGTRYRELCAQCIENARKGSMVTILHDSAPVIASASGEMAEDAGDNNWDNNTVLISEDRWKIDIRNMAEDIHFIKTVVLIYVVLSIIGALIAAFSFLF